jgi:glycosyltransferase
MSNLPKISIVTLAHERVASMRRCIESVCTQHYPNFEHMIVDKDHDTTLDLMRQYPHVRWIAERGDGEGKALNTAMKMATGEIVCVLHADDLMSPNALTAIEQALAVNP